MKIYVVDFADRIQGVYLNKEKAKRKMEEINKRLVDYGGEAMVEEYAVIE